jgi:threonine 3-dehydrogenase
VYSDYAVAIFHDVLRTGKFECYLRPDTLLPMMYIKDCIRSLWEYMVTPADKLKSRVYNVTAMSFTPEELAAAIAVHVPEIKVTYRPDSRQMIGRCLLIIIIIIIIFFFFFFFFLTGTTTP